MDVKLYEDDGVTVFQVNGEINISSSPDLRKHFEKLSSKKIVLDLEKVTYVDSSGLATLVEMLKKTKSKGGILGLAGMTDKVKSLFEITKLDKLFAIYPSRSQAVSQVK